MRPSKVAAGTLRVPSAMATSFPLRHTECADYYKRRARVPVSARPTCCFSNCGMLGMVDETGFQ
jgi:hypothetical protein